MSSIESHKRFPWRLSGVRLLLLVVVDFYYHKRLNELLLYFFLNKGKGRREGKTRTDITKWEV